MPVYYTLIVFMTVSIFLAILLIMLKWKITVNVTWEESLSCHLILLSVGQIVNILISFTPGETLISVRLFKCITIFQKLSSSNQNVGKTKKTLTEKRRLGYKTDMLVWIKRLFSKFTIDHILIHLSGRLDDPYKTVLLSGFIPLLSSLFSQRIEMSFHPTFEKKLFSVNGSFKVHFMGASLVRPVFGLLQTIHV